jgi:hypothetical protein
MTQPLQKLQYQKHKIFLTVNSFYFPIAVTQFLIIINVKYNYHFFLDYSFSILEVRQATRNSVTFISVEVAVN